MMFMSMQVDIYSIIILLVLYFSNITKKNETGQRLYNGLLVCVIAAITSDLFLYIARGNYPGAVVVVWTLASAYYILTTASGYFAVLYCDYAMNHNERLLKKRILPYSIPLAVSVFLTLLNFKIPFLFSFSQENHYQREPFFWTSALLNFAYLLFAVICAAKKVSDAETAAERHEYFSVIMFIVPSIIGGIIQTKVYGVSTNWAGAVISLLLIYINVQNNQISTDALTGIYNRRLLYRYLDAKTANIPSNYKLFAFMIDMDDFKSINDTYGHAAGDRALVTVANILKAACDIQSDYLARMGGDEFSIVCIRHKGVAMPDIIGQIREEIERFNDSGAEPFRLSLSIGAAIFGEENTQTVDELMNQADQQLYAEKSQKKSKRAESQQ